MCIAITDIWGDIGRSADGAEEDAIVEGADAVGFSDGAIAGLEATLAKWTADKAGREERIREIGERITVLWEKLETPEDEQTRFLGSHNGIGDDVIGACSAYMDDKAAEFQARLHELVTVRRPAGDGHLLRCLSRAQPVHTAPPASPRQPPLSRPCLPNPAADAP